MSVMKPKNINWRGRLLRRLGRLLNNREDFVEMLDNLQQDGQVISARELAMMKGILSMSNLKIRDVMISRSDIVSVKSDDDYAQLVRTVQEWQHSRYPVFDPQEEKVVGLLLAKDLLKHAGDDRAEQAFSLADNMRKVFFQPESKFLNVVLDEFRSERSHMVVVMDEFSQVAGIATIEDVIERIVGEIFDESDEADDLVIWEDKSGKNGKPAKPPQVKGTMSLEVFNEHFDAQLPTDTADNLSAWLAAAFGRIPKNGDSHTQHGFVFTVIKADERRVYWLSVEADTNTPRSDEE